MFINNYTNQLHTKFNKISCMFLNKNSNLYYLNFIADTFCGGLSNDLYAQEDLVRYFGKVFRSQKNEYKQIQLITGARVPIVKFLHAPSRLHCDLSFKSGLSTHNTKLVR